jgi:hypothetical protein
VQVLLGPVALEVPRRDKAANAHESPGYAATSDGAS